jgi:hypothetical protein
VQPLWKTVWRHLKKLKLGLPYNSAIPLLQIYPKECEKGYNKDPYTFMQHNSKAMQIAKMPPKRRMKFCHLQVND